jgi:hypothetical protein
MSQYVLNGDHSVEPMDDPVEWYNRFSTDDRLIGQDQVGPSVIVTQFMGVAGGNDSGGRPLCFETLIMKGKLNGRRWLYATYRDAQEGHKTAMETVRFNEGF